MKRIIISLKSLGNISQVPDSQKIFGSLMHLLSEHWGREKTSDFIQQIRTKERLFYCSSLLPKGYCPVPKDYLYERIVNYDKKIYKKIKSMDYFSYSMLKKVFKNNFFAEDLINFEDFIRIEDYYEQRLGLTPFKNDIYAVPKVHIKNKDGKLIKDFNVFIDINEQQLDSQNFIDLLQQLKEQKQILILGKRSTQGNNIYQIDEVLPSTIGTNQENENYLLLGKILPDKINIQESFLSLFTSDRRPYFSGLEQVEKKLDENFISFIKEGSIIKKENKDRDLIQSLSKSIDNPYQIGSVIFGNGYLYPVGRLEVD